MSATPQAQAQAVLRAQPSRPSVVPDIYGGHLSGDTGYQRAIKMLVKGAIPVEEIVTHEIPLQDFREGVDLVHAGSHGKAESIKVVLDPWTSS